MINGAKNADKHVELIGRVYLFILLAIFGGIVLHAPLSVGLGTIWPNHILLIKSWKEILMLVAGVLALILLFKNKQVKIIRSPIIIAIAIFATLHLGLLFYKPQGLAASAAGLAIDLRYLLFFALVYIAMSLYPNYRKLFLRVGVIGALIVLIFALLQVFVLPNDILKYLGYNINTISPYLTVDQNPNFIRINSTLRGPNPLGAYAGIVLALITVAIMKGKIAKRKWPMILAAALLVGGFVALWASYSRSALIGAVVAVVIVLIVTAFRKLSTKLWITIGMVLMVLIGGLYLARDSSYISNLILHENPVGDNSINSNEGHAKSLIEGTLQLTQQPLGAGIGSTGSASLLGSQSEIIENQYLFVAHEAGWLGLLIFIWIFVAILVKLWGLRRDWLALGVFASGVGLALIGLLLPVWVDDTVAIIWWGLAAIALFPPAKDYN